MMYIVDRFKRFERATKRQLFDAIKEELSKYKYQAVSLYMRHYWAPYRYEPEPSIPIISLNINNVIKEVTIRKVQLLLSNKIQISYYKNEASDELIYYNLNYKMSVQTIYQILEALQKPYVKTYLRNKYNSIPEAT